MKMASPLEIEIAIWYTTCGAPAGDYEPYSQAGEAVIKEFLDAGLLVNSISNVLRSYRATDGLRMYVEALKAVPFPVQAWVMPDKDKSNDLPWYARKAWD